MFVSLKAENPQVKRCGNNFQIKVNKKDDEEDDEQYIQCPREHAAYVPCGRVSCERVYV